MQDLSIPNLLDKYTTYCEVIKNYSKQTITSYKNTFKLFCRDNDIQNLNELTKSRVEGWLFNCRVKRNWSASTYIHAHKHINCFAQWLEREGLIENNFVRDIEKPKLEQKLPRTLNLEEAKLILDTSFHMPYRYKFEAYRNRAVIGLMLFTGLRKSEVVNLMLKDVDLTNRTIFVNQGKGNKDRIVPINSRLYRLLLEYTEDKKRLNSDLPYFFLSIGKQSPFGIKGINKLVFRLKEKTKLNFSAHTLRHTFATLMLEGGCDIYTLSKIMGHNKITTTTIYLYCSKKQMDKSIELHRLN